MTEIEFFRAHASQTAELIVICRKMNWKQYEDWKREAMDTAPAEAAGFMEKIIRIVDRFV